MARKSTVAFWSIFIGFCVTATFSIWMQGAFDGISFVGTLLILSGYFICAFFIHLYIKKNPDTVEKWFS